MRIGPHHHQCQRCGAKTECCGPIEQNYDGCPEWTCREFHQADGTINPDWICQRCDWALEDAAMTARQAGVRR